MPFNISMMTLFVLNLLCFIIYIYLYVRIDLYATEYPFVNIKTCRSQTSAGLEGVLKVNQFDEFPKSFSNNEIKRENHDSAGSIEFNTLDIYKCLKKMNIRLPIVTLFTTWKVTSNNFDIYNNTLHNWNSLKPFVSPYLFTNDILVTEEALTKGWNVLPIRELKTSLQLPVLKHMFTDVMKDSSSPFYAYSNGDILFTETLINTLIAIMASKLNKSFPMLITGQRTNVRNITKSDVQTLADVNEAAVTRGTLLHPWAEDYFITTYTFPWTLIPEVVVGRIAYDNWLIWNSKRLGHPTIDATETLLALHQTTQSGNAEGHQKEHRDYNKNLLDSYYQYIEYDTGGTLCTEYYSHQVSDGILGIRKRDKLPEVCTF